MEMLRDQALFQNVEAKRRRVKLSEKGSEAKKLKRRN